MEEKNLIFTIISMSCDPKCGVGVDDCHDERISNQHSTGISSGTHTSVEIVHLVHSLLLLVISQD